MAVTAADLALVVLGPQKIKLLPNAFDSLRIDIQDISSYSKTGCVRESRIEYVWHPPSSLCVTVRVPKTNVLAPNDLSMFAHGRYVLHYIVSHYQGQLVKGCRQLLWRKQT